MFGQVVATHKAPFTHGTHKLLLARVGPAVTRELVRARKLLVAALPTATEGLLT